MSIYVSENRTCQVSCILLLPACVGAERWLMMVMSDTLSYRRFAAAYEGFSVVGGMQKSPTAAHKSRDFEGLRVPAKLQGCSAYMQHRLATIIPV